MLTKAQAAASDAVKQKLESFLSRLRSDAYLSTKELSAAEDAIPNVLSEIQALIQKFDLPRELLDGAKQAMLDRFYATSGQRTYYEWQAEFAIRHGL